jgi:methionyl-tRNA formyltransferase
MLRIWRAEVLPAGAAHSDVAPGTVISCNKQGIDIATGEGVLRVTQLQLPGKKPMDAPAFVNANNISGLQLG